jgi:hypothetical protein
LRRLISFCPVLIIFLTFFGYFLFLEKLSESHLLDTFEYIRISTDDILGLKEAGSSFIMLV